MYFPDDPLFDLDPIFQSVPEHSRDRLIATYDHSRHRRELGARLPLGHRAARRREPHRDAHGQTPSQTVGPYFTMRLSGEGENVLTTPDSLGERIRIEGRVLDGDRKHIEDALIELWQADSAGRYHHPADDRDRRAAGPGVHRLRAVRQRLPDRRVLVPDRQAGPGPAPRRRHAGAARQPDDPGARHAQPDLHPASTSTTRPRPTPQIPVLQSRARGAAIDADRQRWSRAAIRRCRTYRFDIRYQGDDETVFFDV